MNEWKQFLEDETAIGTVEIILILVVLIGIVMIFKKQITNMVNAIFRTLSSRVSSI